MNVKGKNRLAIFGIVLFTIIMIIPFLKINQLGVHSDWSFHSARVQQIFLNLKRGQFFTYIATDTFSKVGNGNFLFYPVVFLYPWAFLKFVFAPITAYLIYVWLIFLTTGLIAFFCMQSFDNKNTRQSFFFSLIYLIAPYHLYLTLTNYVLGEAIAYTFIPIVLLGIYNIFYKNRWITLSVGMALMAYSHYVTLFISVEVCLIIAICYLIQNRKITLNQVKYLIKAIALFIILSAWQFVPLFTDYLGKDLVKPGSGFMLMQTLGDFIVSAFSNDALNRGGIGLLLLIALLFGWKLVNKNSKYMWVYLLGVLLTWMITTAFPWQYFTKTPLSVIQFPYRYTGYAIAFLAIVLSKVLASVKFSYINQYVITSVIILFMLMLYAGSIYPDLARNARLDKNIPVLSSKREGNYRTFRDSKDTPIILNNENYNQQFSYGALYGETDYMPRRSFDNPRSILNSIVYIGNMKEKKLPYCYANRLSYKIKTPGQTNVNLPILAYSNTVVNYNNKEISYRTSTRGTVLVKVKKGINKIEIGYKPSIYLFLFSAFSLIGWIVLISLAVKNKYLINRR